MERPFAWRGKSSRALFVLLTLVACKSSQTTTPPPDTTPTRPDSQPPVPAESLEDWPHLTSAVAKDDALETRVQALIDKMSLEEKVGQITQVEIADVTPDQVKQYYLGSVLNGGGSWPNQNSHSAVSDWVNLADQLWTASMSTPNKIPIIWGTDAVHGHNNVKGATVFPHNIGLGATHDPELLKRIGEVTAREVARTGIDWAFSPTIAVVRDDRWGRTYEGFSENPAVTESYAGKIVEGLQGQLGKDPNTNEKVIATAKHFLGDGGTNKGTDQGTTIVSESDLINIHGRGYYSALQAGAQTVMASYNTWQDTAGGSGAKAYKMHGNKHLLTDVLKTKMGFDGFVISDWNGVGQIKTTNSDSPRDCTNSDCPWAINAGVDMVMVPYSSDWPTFITNTIAQVKSGEISQDRLDDAVRRILRVKMRAGLFEKPKPSERNASHDIGTPEDRAVARTAVAESLVLLKNNGGVLPLDRKAKILVVGPSANDISMQTGGWTITWQGHSDSDNGPDNYPNSTNLWQAIQKVAPNATIDSSTDGKLADSSYDAVVVAIGETPYAEGQGDIGKTKTLEFARNYPSGLALLDSLKAKGVKKIVTVFFSGRALYTNKELNRSDAFVAAFLPGTEGDGMTDVLFKKDDGSINTDFTGKLSYSWPKAPCQEPLNIGDASYDPLFPYGYGLNYTTTVKEQTALDETTQSVGCDVDTSGGTATTPLSLFSRGNQDPYKMYIGAPSNWGGVVVAQSQAGSTTMPSAEITATPVDDRNGIQWAAVRTTWNNNTGQLYIQASSTANLQPYLNSGGALVFDAKVTTAPTGSVKSRVDCHYPCGGEIDITDGLKALPLNTWTEVAIPLQCYADKGTDFTAVDTPFLFYSQGNLEVAVANVRWEPNHAGTLGCGGSPTTPAATQISADTNVWVNGVGNTDFLADPSTWAWTSDGSGKVKVNAAYDIGGGEKAIDITWDSLASGANGVVSLPIKSPTLLDVSPIATTGGLQLELRVIDYGSTSKDLWVKFVCNRDPNGCRTGDLTTLVGHPELNTWTTVSIPFTNSSYDGSWDPTKLSDALDILPAWDDQHGHIEFQLRNVRFLKTLK